MIVDILRLRRVFQSTLPRRERRHYHRVKEAAKYFNPRSREGSDVRLPVDYKLFGNFNPRSREGSDRVAAPLPFRRINFNPRSREGSDKGKSARTLRLNHFNPRSREGSDQDAMYSDSARCLISIHAPAKGATWCSAMSRARRINFNPRSREGSD